MSLSLFDASKPADISLGRNILDINKRAYYSREPTRKRRKKKPIKRARRKVAKGAPKAPLNFRASAAATEIIELSWDDPLERLFTYTIERRQSSEIRNKWVVLKAGLAGNTYLDRNCFVDVTYHYRIFATDESGKDGHISKPAKAGSANCFVHFKRLWNRANQETETIKANPNLSPYERFGQLFDNLCLIKAFQAVRQGDRDAGERESRASAVFIQTKEATEEAIISNAFEAFAHLQDIPPYLDERSHQESLPKAARDYSLTASLRPAALREAFDVFYFAGVDLVKKMSGLIYVTACRKLVDVIATDRSIINLCEHNSKQDRAAKAPRPFTICVDAEATFNGEARVVEFDDPLPYEPAAAEGDVSPDKGNGFARVLLTEDEKATRKLFLADNFFRDRGEGKALEGILRGYKDEGTGSPYSTYMPEEAITPDESHYVIPQVITSAAELADASPRDMAVSYELIFNQATDTGREYLQKRFIDEMTHRAIAEQLEGSSDKKSVRRIERLGASTLAQAKATLTSPIPPGMTAPLLLEAIIKASMEPA
jgi:hypothetical protein